MNKNKIEEKKLIDMGFNFLFCVFSEFLVTRDNTHQYTFIYYHPGNKKLVTVLDILTFSSVSISISF